MRVCNWFMLLKPFTLSNLDVMEFSLMTRVNWRTAFFVKAFQNPKASKSNGI